MISKPISVLCAFLTTIAVMEPASMAAAAGSGSPAFAEKNLSPQWVKSLTERGSPTVYTGKALQYIGMPVGGLCAGELYLGGDGRLWKWDIFNHITDEGEYYVNPQTCDSKVCRRTAK